MNKNTKRTLALLLGIVGSLFILNGFWQDSGTINKQKLQIEMLRRGCVEDFTVIEDQSGAYEFKEEIPVPLW